MKKIGIIGFGNMGGALAAGLVNMPDKYEIIVSELKADRIKLAEEKYNLKNYPDKAELAALADIIIIAVKPQELDTLFKEIREHTINKQIITVCAGRSIDLFRINLNTDLVTRFMPNLAAMEGQSVVGVAFSERTPAEFKADCLAIAGAVGMSCELPESLMPAITGLSGSGIAFVFAFIHAMALGGVASGINYQQSLAISLKTIQGALTVLKKHKISPVDMLSKVISPAGTTIKGVEALEKGGFTYAVMDAITSATQRAAELEG